MPATWVDTLLSLYPLRLNSISERTIPSRLGVGRQICLEESLDPEIVDDDSESQSVPSAL